MAIAGVCLTFLLQIVYSHRGLVGLTGDKSWRIIRLRTSVSLIITGRLLFYLATLTYKYFCTANFV